MYISKFRVANYKSYPESPELSFSPGFNIISGQNNGGKTALLEALSLDFEPRPHRSIRTVPVRETAVTPASSVNVHLTISNQELRELLSAGGGWILLKPPPGTAYATGIDCNDDSPAGAERLVRDFLSKDPFTFALDFEVRPTGQWKVTTARVPSYGLYEAQAPNGRFRACSFELKRDSNFVISRASFLSDRGDVGLQLRPAFTRHIYRFAAERMNVGRGAHGAHTILDSGARNLPEVLGQLQHNVARFRELNHRLSEILPQVKWVSVRATTNGEVEIVVWCHDPESQRDDLAVPLLESGTGIAQVLAILYVVMMSERPQTVIIDEPQSFLHPGATRKLIDFLRGYPQHQFIIATHSAAVISATDPGTITLARFEDARSIVQQIDAKAEHGMRTTLEDLGVRLSDLFGADNILWVEGRTEERCFPTIVERLLGKRLMGTQILGIRETGDLEGRDAKRVFTIYNKLANGATLLPPAIAFVLDEECRSNETKEELRNLSGGLARFLGRRMYENYLLNPAAIAAVANTIEGFRPTPLTADEVRVAIDAKLADPTFYCSRRTPESQGERFAKADAARLLSECFNHFSDTRVTYEKVAHGQALTTWLIENAQEELGEIRDLLGDILDHGREGA